MWDSCRPTLNSQTVTILTEITTLTPKFHQMCVRCVSAPEWQQSWYVSVLVNVCASTGFSCVCVSNPSQLRWSGVLHSRSTELLFLLDDGAQRNNRSEVFRGHDCTRFCNPNPYHEILLSHDSSCPAVVLWNAAWMQPVDVDGQRSTEQTRRRAIPDRSRIQWNLEVTGRLYELWHAS